MLLQCDIIVVCCLIYLIIKEYSMLHIYLKILIHLKMLEVNGKLSRMFFAVPPLFVIEFLHRVVDTLTDYFGDCGEAVLKEHVVVVYELLDEMLDNGFPLATELNILKELIKPPNLLRTIANTVTGLLDTPLNFFFGLKCFSCLFRMNILQ